MCPQNICIFMHSSCIIAPLGLIAESSHVIANTHDFLLGELEILCQHHNRLIAVTLEQSVRSVFPLGIVSDFLAAESFSNDRVLVVIHLTEVVEHTNQQR